MYSIDGLGRGGGGGHGGGGGGGRGGGGRGGGGGGSFHRRGPGVVVVNAGSGGWWPGYAYPEVVPVQVICDPGSRGWQRTGETFETLSLTQSIRRLDGCKWHGLITNGEIVTCGDATERPTLP
jgi:hypothetical protein